MEEFELSVSYKGHDYMFTTTFQVMGYTYRFVVDVNGQKINFEPDEERNYRAVLNYEDAGNKTKTDHELLKAIIEKIREIST